MARGMYGIDSLKSSRSDLSSSSWTASYIPTDEVEIQESQAYEKDFWSVSDTNVATAGMRNFSSSSSTLRALEESDADSCATRDMASNLFDSEMPGFDVILA
eukprot:CAMPEP_0195338176 /NCGR_PEP_ID=MMETSP0708-20121125/17399_1 /TAXON_ID=33640 /ORGANISM="Asterionellopsis glacialis, Strain CCMP134" /LENGTH=101 /DNA_ID=CAMNT_0040409439 /DNA_START=271 /DNA_END=577 /DNA_ORIENTATION=+